MRHNKNELLKLLEIEQAENINSELRPTFNFYKDFLSRHLNQIFPKHAKAVMLVEPITNLATYPILLLWTLIAIASFSFTSLIIITSVAGLALIPLGLIAFFTAKREYIKDRENLLERLTLLQAKLSFIREYTTKNQLSEQEIKLRLVTINPDAMTLCRKDRIDHLKNCFEAGGLITYTVFGTYYLGVSALCNVFGAVTVAAAMTGPAGLILALATAILMGIYFGYNKYQQTRESKYCQALEQKLTEEVNIQKDELKNENQKHIGQKIHKPLYFRTKNKPSIINIPNFFNRVKVCNPNSNKKVPGSERTFSL